MNLSNWGLKLGGNSSKKNRGTNIKRLQNDYFVMFSSVFILGIILALYIPHGWDKILLLPPILFFIFSFTGKNNYVTVLLLLFAAFFSGLFYGNLRITPKTELNELINLNNSEAMLTARIRGDYKYTKNGIKFSVSGAELRQIDKNGKISESFSKIPGKIICHINNYDGEILPEHIYNLAGTFRISNYRQIAEFEVTKIEDTFSEPFLAGIGGSLRLKIKNAIVRALPLRYAGVIIGFVLGDTSYISKEDKTLFREAGISHLLAISGQHIMIIILFLASLLFFLSIPPLSRIIVISLALILYAFVTVGSPSIWRALIMYIAVAISLQLEVRPSPFRPVSIAALLILLYNPDYISDVSFILSFCAIIGIIVFTRPLNVFMSNLGTPSFVSRYISVSFAANLGVVPAGTYFFGAFSSAALIVNPLILWAFAYIIPLSFLIVVIAMFNSDFIMYLTPIITFTLDAVFYIASLGTKISGQYIEIGQVQPYFIALVYGFMFIIASLITKMQIISRLKQVHASNSQPMSYKITQNADKDANEQNNSLKIINYNLDENENYSLKPPTRLFYPLKDAKIMAKTDELMCKTKRPSTKNLPSNLVPEVPISELRIENQNLYYQIQSLTENQLKQDYDVILQSQVYIMSMTGIEFLARIVAHLNPVPDLQSIKPRFDVKDDNLAITLTTDTMLYSSLLTRTRDRKMMMLISKFQNLYSRGYNQFERVMQKSDINETVEVHLALRHDMLAWCKDFIEYDLELKKRKTDKLRPTI